MLVGFVLCFSIGAFLGVKEQREAEKLALEKARDASIAFREEIDTKIN